MSLIGKALVELNIENWIIEGADPTNETEFNERFCKFTQDESGATVKNRDSSTWGVTWAEVETKISELPSASLTELREVRNAKLAETDWEITKHKELGTNIPTALKTYRQALRDITDTYTSLNDVVWPEKP